CAYQGEYFDVW
nr:immunoglobulin heavy chain junction region [Mus musculus]